MITPQQHKKLNHSYNERLVSLLQDGYRLRHETRVGALIVTRLHHMSNGNDIIIHVNFEKGTLTQKTNHIQVHSETV